MGSFMGFAGKEAKGDEFSKGFVQNSFFIWYFLRDFNEERLEDETRCRAKRTVWCSLYR